MINARGQRSRDQGKTSHATPACGDPPGCGALCATRFGPRLGPCAHLPVGGDTRARAAHRDGGLAGHGVGHGAPCDERSSGLEPRHVVSPPGQSDAAGVAPHRLCAPRGDDRPGSRRHRGTPVRADDQGSRVRLGCGALDQEACHPLLWAEVGVDDALGPRALEPAWVGRCPVCLRAAGPRRGAASAGTRRASTGFGR